MRRQLLATAAVVTTTLALAVAVPAIAQSEPEEVVGNVHCDELELEGLTDSFENLMDDVDNEFFTATISDDGKFVTVVAKEGTVILAVIVKGGPNSNVYTEPPFEDLRAPDVPGGIPEISHYEVCIGEEEEETTPPTTPPPTNGETTPAETTPAEVPTEVPAGVNGDSGSAGLVGLMIAASAAAAGFVLFARRRALHDS
jgi:hypothetical protein